MTAICLKCDNDNACNIKYCRFAIERLFVTSATALKIPTGASELTIRWHPFGIDAHTLNNIDKYLLSSVIITGLRYWVFHKSILLGTIGVYPENQKVDIIKYFDDSLNNINLTQQVYNTTITTFALLSIDSLGVNSSIIYDMSVHGMELK